MIGSLRIFFLAVATFVGGFFILLVSPLKLFRPTEAAGYRAAAWIAGLWGDFMRWLLSTLPTRFVITGDVPDPKGTHT